MYQIEPNEADLTDVLKELKKIPVVNNREINDRVFWCEQAIKEIIKEQENQALTIKNSRFDKNKRIK